LKSDAKLKPETSSCNKKSTNALKNPISFNFFPIFAADLRDAAP
jgi:hypothetical protein